MKDNDPLSVIQIIRALIQLTHIAVRLCTDPKTRRVFCKCRSLLERVLDSMPARQRRVFPGSPLRDRLSQWTEAGILCLFVGYLLTLAAAIASLWAAALPHISQLNPMAEPTALFFVFLLLYAARYFYKEALVLRSEVTGQPALVE